MLSAINGDLCLEGKAFDLPQPEENRLSAIYFKSQIHIGMLFFFYHADSTYYIPFVEELFSYADLHSTKSTLHNERA